MTSTVLLRLRAPAARGRALMLVKGRIRAWRSRLENARDLRRSLASLQGPVGTYPARNVKQPAFAAASVGLPAQTFLARDPSPAQPPGETKPPRSRAPLGGWQSDRGPTPIGSGPQPRYPCRHP